MQLLTYTPYPISEFYWPQNQLITANARDRADRAEREEGAASVLRNNFQQFLHARDLAHIRPRLTPRGVLRDGEMRAAIVRNQTGGCGVLQWALPQTLAIVRSIMSDRAARRAARLVAEAARSSRINPAPAWEPVTLSLTHDAPWLVNQLVGDVMRQRNPSPTRDRSHRLDQDEGRYSGRCTFHKIGHHPRIECHGWKLGRVLRWIIDTDEGRIAGRMIVRGQKLPDSAKLLKTASAKHTLAEARYQPAPGDDSWTAQMQAQATAHRIALAVAAHRPVNPNILLSISNAEHRAAAIEATGGWARVSRVLPLIEKTTDGTLHDATGMGVRVLVVRCPSTGKTYGLRVPASVRTVRSALKHVNGIDPSRIVAHT